MAKMKMIAILILFYGISKGSWAWILGAMVLWEVSGGFFLTSLFYFANRSSHHEHGGNDSDHGS